jgi:hypothetical protein
MQSHTYKFGTESFNTLSIAYRRSPFKGCFEFLTIGFIYCSIINPMNPVNMTSFAN